MRERRRKNIHISVEAALFLHLRAIAVVFRVKPPLKHYVLELLPWLRTVAIVIHPLAKGWAVPITREASRCCERYAGYGCGHTTCYGRMNV